MVPINFSLPRRQMAQNKDCWLYIAELMRPMNCCASSIVVALERSKYLFTISSDRSKKISSASSGVNCLNNKRSVTSPGKVEEGTDIAGVDWDSLVVENNNHSFLSRELNFPRMAMMIKKISTTKPIE
jgi:hypothetical protein